VRYTSYSSMCRYMRATWLRAFLPATSGYVKRADASCDTRFDARQSYVPRDVPGYVYFRELVDRILSSHYYRCCRTRWRIDTR